MMDEALNVDEVQLFKLIKRKSGNPKGRYKDEVSAAIEMGGIWRSLSGFVEYWSSRRRRARGWIVQLGVPSAEGHMGVSYVGQWKFTREMKLLDWLREYDKSVGLPVPAKQMVMF